MSKRVLFVCIILVSVIALGLVYIGDQTSRAKVSTRGSEAAEEILISTPMAGAAAVEAIITPSIAPGVVSTSTLNSRLVGSGQGEWDSRGDTRILPPRPGIDDPELRGLISNRLKSESGEYAVGVKNLNTGQMALINEKRVFEAASLFKLSVMVESFQKRGTGLLSFAETLTVTEKAAAFDLGIYRHEIGEPVTITKAISDMITLSDNVYANVLLERVRSADVNKTMRDLGMASTVISREGLFTTLEDVVMFFDLLATGRIQDRQSCSEMINILLAQQIDNQIPFLLPEGVPVAHKTGNLDGLRHDAGIVYAPDGAYVIVVLSENLADGDAGERMIALISKDVYDYFESH